VMMIKLFVLSLLVFCAVSLVKIDNLDGEHVHGEYLITYHLNTTSEDASIHFIHMAESFDIEFLHTWNTGFHKGFAAKIPDDVLEVLQNDPLVMAIETNGIVHLEQACDGRVGVVTGLWGLARVSYSGDVSSGLPLEFVFPTTGGSGVEVYVVDTGVLTTHQQFGGRARFGANYVTGEGNSDGNGHGTHCAGTVAGSTYGVAKAATIVAVKVLNSAGSGTYAAIVSGVNYATNNGYPYKSVVSMSLGGTTSNTALRTAIDNAVASNIAVVVAAGNSNADACNFYPAGYPSCITVGATAMNTGRTLDSRSTFSNWGTCVHIFAPGTNILSAWIGTNTASNTISGTSMACPHVAGLSAQLLAINPAMTPATLRTTLQANSQKDLISDPRGSPNNLAYNMCN